MITWRVWFSDGDVADNAMYDVPHGHIQVIVFRKENGDRGLLHGRTYYWLEGKMWFGGELDSLVIHLLHNAPEIICVRSGYTIKDSKFQKLLTLAQQDPDFA